MQTQHYAGGLMRTTIVAITFGLLAWATPAAAKQPTSTTEATSGLARVLEAPTFLRYLQPGRAGRVPKCKHGMAGDVYRWNGEHFGLAGAYRRGLKWRDSDGWAVVYNHRTRRFRNRTRQPVLVAAWCMRTI